MIIAGAIIYLCCEISFYLVYLYHIKKSADDLSKRVSQPYHDYGNERAKLMKRIWDRMEDTCRLTGEDFPSNLYIYFSRWFHSLPKEGETAPLLLCDHDTKKERDSFSFVPGEKDSGTQLFLEAVTSFMAWAFFDSKVEDLDELWQKEQLEMMLNLVSSTIVEHTNTLPSAPEKKPFQARRMTLEKVNPIFKPLFVYVLFWIIRQIGHLALLYMGFDRHQIIIKRDGSKADSAMTYWYRAAQHNSIGSKKPIMFFHGISPGGLTLYLPWLQKVVLRGNFFWGGDSNYQNPVFLFENEPITCKWTFDALTETETVHAVHNALARHGFGSSKDKDLTLLGHSFGSFQLTWMLRSRLRSRINQFILLDPVSILLSEPDVVLNFLYGRGADEALVGESFPRSILIRLFFSSEIFIENYLRRHFAWYNSELWLEDIPDHVDTTIYVALKDEIYNAHKVGIEVQRINDKRSRTKSKLIKLRKWHGYGHGACLALPSMWREVSQKIHGEKTNH